jgi:hypothetical protein
MPAFERYIGIDYSGAETPEAGLSGLRIYMAERASDPVEVRPPTPQRHWTRRGIAEWLVKELSIGPPTLAGIDHGFSFPLEYFAKHRVPRGWPAFLDDFQLHWPTDRDHTYVDFVREGIEGFGNGAARGGNTRWRRLTEKRAGAAKSVFHFDVPGQVAKSTHAGIPWLRHIKRETGARVHFWPFDGWEIPASHSAIVEIYPSLWKHNFAREDRNDDQHDAYCAAAWMRNADRDGMLASFFAPVLSESDKAVAQVEGWILGVGGEARDDERQPRSTRNKQRQQRMPDFERFDAAALQTFVKALAFASRKHSQQRRKDAEESPYINHPIALVSILSVEAGISDPEVLCAALLHDTIEDTNTTRAELEGIFGKAVAAIVVAVTDDKSLTKEKRKELQVEHAPHLSEKAKLVKLADKTANLRDVADNPPANWPLERRREYFDWAKRVVDAIGGIPPQLRGLFDAAYARRP